MLIRHLRFEKVRPVNTGFRRVLAGRVSQMRTVDTYSNSFTGTMRWRVLQTDFHRLYQLIWGVVEFRHIRNSKKGETAQYWRAEDP